jgi:hypothetical protein
VPRRFLEAISGVDPLGEAGSGRLTLARQMTDPHRTPLVPRVMVNRIWHHLFGLGLVPTTDNFGASGELPTHPELLDYLARRFVAEGWSVKAMIRLLVLSAVYQQSSNALPSTVDPTNVLLSRARVRRLQGEAIRDSMLQVTGGLDRTMFGPSVPIHLTAFLEGRGRPENGPLDGRRRRSIYLAVRRNFLSPFLLAFDSPSPFSTVGRRTVSNVPAQALILLNDPFVHQQAQRWAEYALKQPGDDTGRINHMFLAAFSRPATPQEQDTCLNFLREQAACYSVKLNDPAPWADLAHTLFNAKEFIFLN